MRTPTSLPRRRAAVSAVAIVAALVVTVAAGPPVAAGATGAEHASPSTDPWIWPIASARLDVAFVAPPHPYGAGHRGIDVRSSTSDRVVAPSAGVVAFEGEVAGRGVITIDHGHGLVTTLEPVTAMVDVGDVLAAGDPVGTVASGGHAAAGAVHFGVRRNGEYINPLLLLGGVPRAVLLPCC